MAKKRPIAKRTELVPHKLLDELMHVHGSGLHLINIELKASGLSLYDISKMVESMIQMDHIEVLVFVDPDFYSIPNGGSLEYVRMISKTINVPASGSIPARDYVFDLDSVKMMTSIKPAGVRHYYETIDSENRRLFDRYGFWIALLILVFTAIGTLVAVYEVREGKDIRILSVPPPIPQPPAHAPNDASGTPASLDHKPDGGALPAFVTPTDTPAASVPAKTYPPPRIAKPARH